MQALIDDTRSAFKALVRRPRFALLATLLLGLGLGAATAVFTLIDACLLRPLPFADADRLVRIGEEHPGAPRSRAMSPFHLFLLQAESRSYERIAHYVQTDSVGFDLLLRDHAERVVGAAVSADFFPLLGVQPALGRWFTESEDTAGEPVVILGDRLWRSAYGGDRSLLGRAVKVSGRERTVVGIMPPGFEFPGVELWVPNPVHVDRAMDLPLTATYSQVVLARLKDGVTLEQARGELTRLTRSLWESDSWAAGKQTRFSLVLLREAILGDLRIVLWVLFGSTGLLLLITCTNLSNLLLGRALARQPELALRLVLGATDRRLARQLLTESLALGVAGGGAGVLFSALSLKAAVPLLAQYLPPGTEVRINLRVLGFLALAAILTGMLTGLAPVLRRSRLATRERLAESPSSSAGRRGRRLWGRLVMAQLALSFVLLVGVGLMLRTYWELASRHLGFDPGNVVTFDVPLPKRLYPSRAEQLAFVHRASARLAGLPGVVSVAFSQGAPLTASGMSTFLVTREEQVSQEDLTTLPEAVSWYVTPPFLQTLGIRLKKGRGFTTDDTKDAPPVVIVDEAVESRLWPGESALGKRLYTAGRWAEVVGVAAPVAAQGPRDVASDVIYLPLDQGVMLAWSYTVTLRTSGPPLVLIPMIRQALQEISPEQTIHGITTMEARLAAASSRERLTSLLLGGFALIGLSLALCGLFAVVRYAVLARRREIGIRLALGASRPDVLKLVLGHGGRLIAAGLVAGLAVALPSARLLARLLYGVTASDPLTYAAVALLVAATALPAVILPALEALRIDPVRSIRSE